MSGYNGGHTVIGVGEGGAYWPTRWDRETLSQALQSRWGDDSVQNDGKNSKADKQQRQNELRFVAQCLDAAEKGILTSQYPTAPKKMREYVRHQGGNIQWLFSSRYRIKHLEKMLHGREL
jgi:hypothetical protein